MSQGFHEHHENVEEFFRMDERVKGRKKYGTKVAATGPIAMLMTAAAVAVVLNGGELYYQVQHFKI